MHCIVIILYCIQLHCSIFIVLYFILLYCTAIVLHCIVLLSYCIVMYCVEEEFGKENQNGRIIIFDIKYEFHSEVGHNQKQ